MKIFLVIMSILTVIAMLPAIVLLYIVVAKEVEEYKRENRRV